MTEESLVYATSQYKTTESSSVGDETPVPRYSPAVGASQTTGSGTGSANLTQGSDFQPMEVDDYHPDASASQEMEEEL